MNKEKQIEIEHYLGIVDNNNSEYKEKVVSEYKEMEEKYPHLEQALTEDLGIYIPYSQIIETGEYISVFVPAERKEQ